MDIQDNTKKKIIDVAAKLFLEKGYEETTIAEIIKGLDGLTKGAIYYYFDSKEDIFNAVVDEIGKQNMQAFDEIKNDDSLNAAEKLSKIVAESCNNSNMDKITSMSPSLLKSPKLLSAFMLEIKEITIPQYILPIVNEGVKDGSIRTDHPDEVAELIAVLLNVWLNPLIFESAPSNMSDKMKIINELLSGYNIKLFDTK